jgi:hypothetical protein
MLSFTGEAGRLLVTAIILVVFAVAVAAALDALIGPPMPIAALP